MTEQIYYTDRNVYVEDGIFETIKKEMILIFLQNKALLDAKLDAAEEYTFSAKGFKVLKDSCEPIRSIEYNRLIIKNNIVVGSVILRVNNNRPTHGCNLLMDTLTRTYELRFKTFAGCDFTVESCGLAVTQVGENGPIRTNSGTITGFSDKILERHWAEFKSECTFTQGMMDQHTKLRKWTKANRIYARS